MLGVVVQALGWILLNYVQGHLPASIVSPSLLGQPVITAFLAWQFLGEIFTIWHMIGGTFVLIGIYVVHRSQFKLKPETAKC
jgi:drug/metabolite transporter (DMT)-like permease